MIRKTSSCLGLLLVLLSSCAATKTKPLMLPPAIHATDAQLAERAIRLGLAKRGWRLEAARDGVYTAALQLRTHHLRIRLTHRDGAIRFSYLDSQNLMYSDRYGTPVIHRQVNNWLRNLEHDINYALAASQ